MRLFTSGHIIVKKLELNGKLYSKYYLLIGFILLLLLSSNMVKSQCNVSGTASGTVSCMGSTGGTASITLSGTGSGAPGTYTVDGGSLQSFSTNPFAITGLAAGTHNIVATVTEGGCVSSNIAVTIVSSTLPLPAISASASSSSICSGSSTNLTASGATSYTWMPGSLTGSGITVSPVSTTNYTVTGTNADGCARSNTWAKISSGGYHTLGIKTDGTLWGWGYNLYGQVGDGTNIDKNSPVQIGTSNDWVFISTGIYHSFGIKTNGTLWAWGFNNSGQLGDGSIINRNIPVQIGVATNWAAASGGGSHSAGIKTDGTIWAWGSNMYGQIGDGTGTQRNNPVQVGVATNWSSIFVGSDHTLALKTDGTLWSWGRNTFGQLGDGTINSRTSPLQIAVGTSWKKISACFFHSLAIKTDGTLWAWGSNMYGELGDGTTTQRNSPIQTGVATDWADVEGGIYYSIGTKTNGTAWGWGMNGYGQIGDGTTMTRSVSVQVGTASNWNILSGGVYHSSGLRSDGSLWTWGRNMEGQLGDGTNINKIVPIQINTAPVSVLVTVNPLPSVSFSGLASSYCQTASAVTLTGSPAGGTFSGTGVSGNTFNPTTAGVGTYTITYAYTDAHGCSNSASQSVTVTFTQILDYVNLQFPGTASFCQGGSLTVYGQIYEPGLTEAPGAGSGVTAELGYSTSNTNPATWTNWQPASFNVQVGNNDEYFSTLNLPAGTYYYAFRYSYVLNACGYQYGGYSASGGNPWDGVNYISGVLVVNPLPALTISPASPSICNGSSTVLTASGASAYAWMPGSLSGTNVTVSPITNTTYTLTGTSVAGCAGGNVWATITSGGYHNLGIKTNGTLWSSGDNSFGQVGDGTTVNRLDPVQIGTANNWVMVSAGGFHSLAIKSDGTLWAWGTNVNGQLGDGTTVDKHIPVQIGTATNWAGVSAGGSHSLAIKTDGTLWAWGSNTYGQLGDGTGTQRNSPVQVGNANTWVSFSAGGYHNIAIKSNGTLWTWGRGGSGQLGDGTVIDKVTPVQIGALANWRKIAAGFFHSLAIKTDGTLWSWGRNMNGQIGDGTTTQRNDPVQIGTGTNWANIDAGLDHSIGTKTNGTLWGWGSNMYGQLGDGTMIQRPSPIQTGVSTNSMIISAGSYHNLSVKTDGSLWAWGRNMEGQLGDGHSLTYQLSQEQIGTTAVSVTVTVNSLPVVSFTGLSNSYCVNLPVIPLTGSPAGGIFSGPGISGNVFDPSLAGSGGPYTIVYTYTNGNGCSNTASQTVMVNSLPSVSFSGLTTNYCTTDPLVTLVGLPSGGTFSGPGVTGNTFNPANAGAGGPYNISYTYTNGNGCTNTSTQQVSVNLCSIVITLNMKLFLQGYYIGGNFMQSVLNNQGVPSSLATETDTITVELHDPETFALVDTKQALLLTDGNVSATFAQTAGIYYIAIKHRNSIQTWSASAVACSVTTPLYDFTTAANKAFGDNQVEVEPGVWAFYVGDINQDEFVDGFDYSGYNDDNLAGVNSAYTSNDLNGDGFVDGFDYSQYNDNNLAGIMSIHP